MTQTFQHRATPREQQGFRRDIGLTGLLFVSLGSIIGSGWLLAALAAAKSAGGSSILSYALGGVVIAPLALVHAELGAAYPLAGGTGRWPRLAFGSLCGFTAGWVAWLQAVTIAPIEVEAALTYVGHQLPGLINDTGALTTTGLGVATALMLLFTVINILGVRWLTESNRITVLWKIIVPVVAVVVLIAVQFRASNFTAGGGFAPYGAHGVFAALPLGVVFALQGFEQATQLAGEVRNPQRNVFLAVIGAVVVSAVLYLALQIAFIGALNPSDLVSGWAHPVGNDENALYATLAGGLGLGWLAAILHFDGFISPAGAGLVYLGASARLSYALGHSGYVPRGISQISGRGVPYISIFLAFIVGLICFLPFPTWQSLVSLVTSATVIMYAFAPITLLALRKVDPDQARPYRMPVAPILAPLAFVAANEIIYWATWPTVEKLMLAILAGYLLFGISYALGPRITRPPLDSRSLVWIVPWFSGLAVISYLGQYGGTKLIPEWVDLGLVAVLSLVICYVAVQLSLPAQRVTVIRAEELELIRATCSEDRYDGGVVRKLRYSQSEFVVLDASAEVLAVNWTTRIEASAFVSETARRTNPGDSMRVILSISSNPRIQITTMSNLRKRLVGSTFDTACQFVRLDLSATQSAFWELPPDQGLAVVGFGGAAGTFTEDTVGLVRGLLAATATSAVNVDEVLISVRTLAQQYTNS